MKTIGIIGGIGPESTIDYYRGIIDAYRDKRGTYPTMIINSLNLDTMVRIVTANQRSKLIELLVNAVRQLADAGAECGLLSANTPHMVFDEVSRDSRIPLVSIVEASCAAAKKAGHKRLALLGTRFTMQGDFFPAVFSREGIALVVPTPEEQTLIHDKYMNELLKGSFLPETRTRLLTIISRLHREEGVDGVILAGTELPLLLRESQTDVPLLDTTRIHIDAIVEESLR